MIWNKKKKEDAAAAQQSEETAAAMPKITRHLKWLIPLVCVAVAAGVFWTQSQKTQASNVSVEYIQEMVSRRTISQTLSGTGTLKAAATYTVKAQVAGEILEANFEESDMVEKEQVLYRIDDSGSTTSVEQAQIALQQAQRNYDKVADKQYVRAEVTGTVYTLMVQVGDEVKQGQEVAVIRDSTQMLLQLEFPAVDAAQFKVGQSATITLDSTFEVLQGRVTAVSGSDALSDGNLLVRTVTLSVPNAGTLNSTQAATAVINGVSSIKSSTFSYQAEKTLTAGASGEVSEIYVTEGSPIEKDAILFSLKGDDLDESIQNAAETLRSAELSMENVQDQLKNYTVTSPSNGLVVEKSYKQGDTVEKGQTLCTLYDISYLEMIINMDELDIKSVEVGQSVEVTADAISGETYSGVVTRVSAAGTTSGGTTTYPVTVRIDEIGGLMPGMNANAEIVVGIAEDAISVSNAAVERNFHVLVTKDSPSAVNALPGETAPEGFVYVEVTTGISDDNHTEILSGLQEGDTVGYDASSTSSEGYFTGSGGY